MSEADDLVESQIEYYRARAPRYDDWWFRRGKYEAPNEEFAAEWDRELTTLYADLDAWLRARPVGHLLELAAGTGNMTQALVEGVERMTAVDASPETLEINAAKLGERAARVEYVVADLFDWSPPQQYDAIAFGFWASHVPPGEWDGFWAMVHAALKPGGRVWLCDNAPPELVPPHMQPDRRDGTIDPVTFVHEREFPDGRVYRIIKHNWDPAELQRDLESRGFEAHVTTTNWAFTIAHAHPA